MNRKPAYARSTKPPVWLRWTTWVGILLCLLFCSQVWYIIYRSDWFRLQEIQIVGAELIQEDHLLKISGLKRGMRVFEIDFESVSKQMRDQEPLLRSVRILQTAPNRLQIRVDERKPVFWIQADDEYLAVSQDGYFLPLTPDFQNPRIQVSLLEEEIRERRLNNRLLQKIRSWTGLLEHSMLADYRQLDFRNRTQAKLYYEGVEFLIESSESFLQHEDKILPFLKKVKDESRQLRYIDIRFDNMVVRFD